MEDLKEMYKNLFKIYIDEIKDKRDKKMKWICGGFFCGVIFMIFILSITEVYG